MARFEKFLWISSCGIAVIKFFTSWISVFISLHKISCTLVKSSAIPIGANRVIAWLGRPCSILLLMVFPEVLILSGSDVEISAVLAVVVVVVTSPGFELTVMVYVDPAFVAEVCGISSCLSSDCVVFCGFTVKVVGLLGTGTGFSSFWLAIS